MCEFKSAKVGSLWSHKNSAHVNKRHICNRCDYTNVSSWKLKEHVQRKHTLGGNIFRCDTCKYETSTRVNLNRHSRYKHDTCYIKCEFCEFTGNASLLSDHKRNYHGELKGCTDCDYKPTSRASLMNHQRNNHMGMIFDCDECDKKINSKEALKTHKDNKHKGLRHRCPKCNYQATQKGSLKIHMQAMHETATYPCDNCSYRASTPRSLSRHTLKCSSDSS